jgi:hypothetical protein
LKVGPDAPAVQTVTVPSSEVWHIVDIFTQGVVSGGADGQLVININGFDQPLSITLSAMDINKLSRFTLPQSIPIPPNATVYFKLVLLGAVGASAVTQTVNIKLIRIPYKRVQ